MLFSFGFVSKASARRSSTYRCLFTGPFRKSFRESPRNRRSFGKCCRQRYEALFAGDIRFLEAFHEELEKSVSIIKYSLNRT